MTDECYCHFLYDGEPFSIASMPGAKETVLVAGTLSKTYAMTGWRIGFGLAPAPIIGAMMKLQSHSTSNPTSIAQKAAVEAMRGPQESVAAMLAEYRKRRDFVVQRLREIPGVKCARAAGRILRLSEHAGGHRQERHPQFAAIRRAIARGGARRRSARGGIRHGPPRSISYATSMKELERGLDRIHQIHREELVDMARPQRLTTFSA